MTFKKSEIKYIVYAIAFAAAWFIFVLPNLAVMLNDNSPYFQFLVFNVGLILFFQIFLKSVTTSTRVSLMSSIGLVCIYLALDTISPPYRVSLLGDLISSQALLGTSAVDYIWGILATNLGLSGLSVYLFTYLLMPLILLVIAAKLFPNFVKSV
jgi:cell division protein FtsW (lipid II flippase)